MSGLQKNVAGQKWRVYAWDITTGAAKTGDAANITAKIAKDWAALAATDDVNPTESENGYYHFDLTQAESNADVLDFSPESSTANIQVRGVPESLFPIPFTLNYLAASVSREHRDSNALIESQRGAHTHTGNIFYWDPINGNDSWDGLSKATARATFASIHTNLVIDNNHDVVIAIPGDTTGPTITAERITISKNYTFLRGPGRDFKMIAVDNGDVIGISGTGVEISGLIVQTHTSGSGIGINVDGGEFARIHSVWIEYSRSHAIQLKDTKHSLIYDATIYDAGASSGHGIHVDGSGAVVTQHNYIYDVRIHDCGNDGIHFKGANCTDNYVFGGSVGCNISHNGGWGITDNGTAPGTHVLGTNIHISQNTSGNVSLTAAGSSELHVDEWAKEAVCTEARLVKLASLTFTKANELDSNLQSVNNTTITGDGDASPYDVP